jgi:alpha-amylase
VGNNFKIQAYALILLRPEGYPCVFYGDLYPNQCYDEAVASRLRLLIDARRLFAYGRTDDYFQERNCIGFVRRGDSEHPGCAVLISNQGSVQRDVPHVISMHVGTKSKAYRSFLDPHAEVIITADGWGLFSCLPNHVEVWVPAN